MGRRGGNHNGDTDGVPSARRLDTVEEEERGGSETGLAFAFDPGSFVYISAQGRGGSNNVICCISVDGKVISQNSATGYGIATCKGKA